MYASMHLCVYESMNLLIDASMHIPIYESMHVCTDASMNLCIYASMHLFINIFLTNIMVSCVCMFKSNNDLNRYYKAMVE